MLITAVINNRGNTLVVDMPRDRMDLDTKLYSIGQELSHNTPITEDPDSDVTVTLSASSFKGNVSGSIPEYSFHWHGKSDRIFLFEAPIDMLSFISMHKENWYDHSYAASCSVSDRVLFQCLKDNPNIKKVYLCFDNDCWGQQANQRITEKLNQMGIESHILKPQYKDWNQDWLNQDERSEQLCYHRA